MAADSGSAPSPLMRVGVLALQGSFREHIAALLRCAADMNAGSIERGGLHGTARSCGQFKRSSFPSVRPSPQPFAPPSAALRRCAADMKALTIEAVEVRTDAELRAVQALIIPGGESTTMANLAQRCGLLGALQEFAASGRPVWGTCAGLIFLANKALGFLEGEGVEKEGLVWEGGKNWGRGVHTVWGMSAGPILLVNKAREERGRGEEGGERRERGGGRGEEGEGRREGRGGRGEDWTVAGKMRLVKHHEGEHCFRKLSMQQGKLSMHCVHSPVQCLPPEPLHIYTRSLLSPVLHSLPPDGPLLRSWQINSFEILLPFPHCTALHLLTIVATPAIIHTGPAVEVLAEYPLPNRASALDRVAVAVRQGRLLATAFHPELTADLRWHRLFLQMILDALQSSPDLAVAQASSAGSAGNSGASSVPNVDPGDLPVFGSAPDLKIELKPVPQL
ncbi:unnamed protein product [Closterium sp. NIES-65]|nr:unnamed protein product [Closterium sp. NIES-65]